MSGPDGVVLLALDRILEVLTETRDALRAAQEDGEEEPQEDGLLQDDE